MKKSVTLDINMAASQNRTVCIVGAGIIGLSTAVNIIETIPDVEVTIVAESFDRGIASIVSGGMWNPRETLTGTSLSRLQKWSRVTWTHSIPLALSTEASKIGIEFIPGYRLYPERFVDVEEPWWKDDVIGYRRVPQKEIQQLFAPTFQDGYAFMTLITNNAIYLPYLTQRFKNRGGKMIQMKVGSLGEFAGKYDVVVNCSGLGAKFLAKDDTVTPLRGQILRVRAPMQHFFILSALKEGMKSPLPSDRTFYVFPRNGEVILGGTLQKGRWDMTPDPEDSRDILERTTKVIPSLKGSEIVTQLVGLRPNRSGGVRLEAETMTFGDQTLQVVHNYGHEGNGVTLHWGCAQDVTKLVQQALSSRSRPDQRKRSL